MSAHKTSEKSAALWVCNHWIETWFAVRHTGGYGHTAGQAKRHVRYWIAVRREEYGRGKT